MASSSPASAVAAASAFDPREFRAALGSFATGVTVITARAADGTPIGLTANSFNSVSLDPPMVLWSLAKKAFSLPVFMETGHWAVHVLAADQEELSNRFARAGEDKFSGLALERGGAGVPLLPGCAARFECETSFRYEGGDHIIFVGQVRAFERTPRAPLVFHGGRYAQAAAKVPLPVRSVGGFREDLLGYQLARAHHQFHLPLRTAMAAAGLSEDAWAVVAAMAVRDGLAAGELADALRVVLDGPIRSVLDRLVADGWARAEGEPSHYTLTDPGRERALQLLAQVKAREDDLLGLLGEAEGALLKSLLQRLNKAADPGLPDLWAGGPPRDGG